MIRFMLICLFGLFLVPNAKSSDLSNLEIDTKITIKRTFKNSSRESFKIVVHQNGKEMDLKFINPLVPYCSVSLEPKTTKSRFKIHLENISKQEIIDPYRGYYYSAVILENKTNTMQSVTVHRGMKRYFQQPNIEDFKSCYGAKNITIKTP